MNTKLVIVMRKDLKMRRGKEIAQGGHASMAWLKDRLKQQPFVLTSVESDWLFGLQTKVCVTVDSYEELMTIATKAHNAGLKVRDVVDAGLTEFNGTPTTTCIGIGPDLVERIDPVTGDLKLY